MHIYTKKCIAGGMQDYNYRMTNCFEITVEMGCFKFPEPGMLRQLWDDHKYSLISYLHTVCFSNKIYFIQISIFE